MLGDKDAQDKIRAAHPHEKHCPMLRQKPNACIGCPNNPHEQPQASAPAEHYGPLLERAFRIHALGEFGLLRPEEMSATDFDLLQTVHEEILIRRMKVQAALIAERVAQLFSGS